MTEVIPPQSSLTAPPPSLQSPPPLENRRQLSSSLVFLDYNLFDVSFILLETWDIIYAIYKIIQCTYNYKIDMFRCPAKFLRCL